MTAVLDRAVRDDHHRALLARLGELSVDDPERAVVRDEVIKAFLPMAGYLARRYVNRGEAADDLVQVATIGLIKAVDGFDGDRGAGFSSYAVPTIVGELKRHFRDKSWSIRVPRALQELHLNISRATDTLTQRLGRSPTVTDLARHLSVGEEEILDALDAGRAYNSLSLDAPIPGSDGAHIADMIGGDDSAIGLVENRLALKPLLAQLPPREQRIIALRFFDNLTQSEIAAQLGISQMHVSRLLSQSLRQLREGLQVS
ncbi:MAG TPA: RNA polymerase sigma factor SigF [Micromonosporaceae bacterium]|nr:RNA polymerase sigma factor SigF [Micromonosporaceae bacterium]